MNVLSYKFWHTYSRLTAISSYSSFRFLLEKLKPDLVCDVGSRDGADAFHFTELIPDVEVHAFEANPVLVEKMKNNARLTAAGVVVNWNAVTNRKYKATFKVPDLQTGNGSLRATASENPTSYDVECIRLDEYLGKRGKNIALWIDVEGCGYEVLEGLGEVASRVMAIHIEVELKPFWTGQKLIDDTEKLMKRMGFLPLAATITHEVNQGNITFIREDVLYNTPGLFDDIFKLTVGNLAVKWKLDTKIPQIYKLGKFLFPRKSVLR